MEIRILDRQREHWDSKLSNVADMFGVSPSETARRALEIYWKEGVKDLLELGAGQGRDTLFFAGSRIKVTALDYSESGVNIIRGKAEKAGLSNNINAICMDIRTRLSFEDDTFDACYGHMTLCMALTDEEIEFICNEVRRVLKLGGIFIYTVRNTEDPHYGKGIHRGEEMFETNGFIVHFFSEEKVIHFSKGFKIINIERCEESRLPRRLFRVVLKKS